MHLPTAEVPAQEAVDIRVHRSRSWLRKASKATDLNSQFIFLWIALNALYGTPRYLREIREIRTDETQDLESFIADVENASREEISAVLRRPELEGHVSELLRDKFLNVDCWRAWAREGTRDRRRREALSSHVYDKRHPPARLFRQLYTLRNQILHGSATDNSRWTRTALLHAVPILDACVEALIPLVKKHHTRLASFRLLPYPPSVDDGVTFNGPRVRQDASPVSGAASNFAVHRPGARAARSGR